MIQPAFPLIEDLFETSPPLNFTMAPLARVFPGINAETRFLRAIVHVPLDIKNPKQTTSAEVSIPAHQWHEFEESYAALLESQAPENDHTPPKIPLVYDERSKTWAYVPIAVKRYAPTPEAQISLSPEHDPSLPAAGAFRLQSSVSADVALRFTRAAKARGLTRQAFLLHLIDVAISEYEAERP